MMIRKIYLIFGVIVALFLLIISSCEKQDSGLLITDVEETMFMENVDAQLFTDVEEAVNMSHSAYGRFGHGYFFGFGSGGCVTVSEETPEDSDYPKIITLFYVDECESKGVVKSGSIIVELTNEPGQEGSQRIITFDNFYVNDNKIEGVQTFTNLGKDSFSSTFEGGKVITSEGTTITRNSERIMEKISGGDTDDFFDDIYQITGWAKGINSEGVEYEKTITEPLIRSRDCFWITQGVIESVVGESTVVIDFGDGTCDNIAIRTENGGDPEEINMDLRIKKFKKLRMR